MEKEKFIISHYESMSLASTSMLNAARRSDWDSVAAAEKDCARIIEELKTLGDLVPQDPLLKQRKAEIIRKVLAEDKEIRDLAQPWLNELESFIKSASTNKKLVHTYSSVGREE